MADSLGKRIKDGIGLVADIWSLFGAILISVAIVVVGFFNNYIDVLMICLAALLLLLGLAFIFIAFLRHHDRRPDTVAQYKILSRSSTYSFSADNLRHQDYTIEMKIQSKVPELAVIQQKFKWSGEESSESHGDATASSNNGGVAIVWSPFDAISGLTYYALMLQRPMTLGETRTISITHRLVDKTKDFIPELSMNVTKRWESMQLQVLFPPTGLPHKVQAQVFKGTVFSPGPSQPLDLKYSSSTGVARLRVDNPKRKRTYRIFWDWDYPEL